MINNYANALFAAAAPADGASILFSFAPFVLVIVAMYFMIIRPQKKRQREVEKMRSELSVGNRIVTIGGFIGRIVKIGDDVIYVNLGDAKNNIALKKWAVHSVLDHDMAKAIEKQAGAKSDKNDTYATDEAAEELLFVEKN